MKVNKTQCCYVPACVPAKFLQLCPTLFDAMECSLPGSSVRGILQARTLEWGAISFSRVKRGADKSKSMWKVQAIFRDGDTCEGNTNDPR